MSLSVVQSLRASFFVEKKISPSLSLLVTMEKQSQEKRLSFFMSKKPIGCVLRRNQLLDSISVWCNERAITTTNAISVSFPHTLIHSCTMAIYPN